MLIVNILCLFYSSALMLCNFPTIFDKTEAFVGESLTINCSASRVPSKTGDCSCVPLMFLRSFNPLTSKYDTISTYISRDNSLHHIFKRPSWRSDNSPLRAMGPGYCQPEAKVQIIVFIPRVELEDGTVYKCEKACSKSLDSHVLIRLTILPAAMAPPVFNTDMVDLDNGMD
ncbi:hypothetical protein Btru_062824 [Bulinus truncatus]|nr:hypothetical protein Btru_062824 [Bulinus truncatus]